MVKEFLKTPRDRWREWGNGTINQRIFRATLTVSFMTAIVILGYIAKDLVVAGWFGTSDDLDAFLIAFLVPWTTLNIMAGAFSSAVIPNFISVRDREGTETARRFFSQITALSALLLLAATLILAATELWLLKLFGSGFGPGKLALTRSLFHALLPILFVGGMSQMWTAVLNAGERFALAALAPLAVPLAAVIAMVTAGQMWGVHSLAVGTTLGYLLEFLLVSIALGRHGLRPIPRWFGIDGTIKHVMNQYAHILAANFLLNCVPLANQAMAATLASGSVSALNYGTKLIGPLLALGPSALGTAALPYFSVLAGKRDPRSTRHTIKTYVVLVLVATIPVTIAFILFSEPLIGIVFQRGAFTAEDTSLVAGVQVFWAMQLPAYSLMALGLRMLSAAGRNPTMARIGILDAVLNVALSYLLMQIMGVKGIALATSITITVGAGLTFLALKVAGILADDVAGGREEPKNEGSG